MSIGASDDREHNKNLLPHGGKIPPPLDAKAPGRLGEVAGGFGRTGRCSRASTSASARTCCASPKRLTSEYFRVRLLQLEFDRPATIRIQGLAIGLNVGHADYAEAIHDNWRRNGLLVSTAGSTVLRLLSLAIDKRSAARGLDILSPSI